jgi:hypothetical protein
MENVHDTPVQARIRKQLKAIAPNELTYIGPLQVARDANKRAYMFIVKNRRMNLDQCVNYIVNQQVSTVENIEVKQK